MKLILHRFVNVIFIRFTQIHKFKVEMTCSGCSGAVENVLKKLGDAIEKVDFDMDARIVTVTSKLTHEKLLETIKKTGKETSYLETINV